MMKKFVCGICGFVYEGTEAPEKCPQCGAPKEKFTELVAGVKEYADEHRVGVAKGVDERILEGLRLNFTGECSEVGMYLAMSRVADRQAIRKSQKLTNASLSKKLNTLLNSLNSSAKSLPTTPRPTSKCVLLLNRALAQARKKSLPSLNSSTSMLSMTRFMKWQKTKLVTAVYSMASWLVTSQNNPFRNAKKGLSHDDKPLFEY